MCVSKLDSTISDISQIDYLLIENLLRINPGSVSVNLSGRNPFLMT